MYNKKLTNCHPFHRIESDTGGISFLQSLRVHAGSAQDPGGVPRTSLSVLDTVVTLLRTDHRDSEESASVFCISRLVSL